MTQCYHETQRMMQPNVAATLIVILTIVEAAVIASYLGYLDIGNENDLVGTIVPTVILAAICILAETLRMDVTVTDREISIRTVGTKTIALDDIEGAEIRDRSYAVKKFGGWGVRLWIRGVGYVAPGSNGGVEIRIRGRKTGVLISSRDPEALLAAISESL